MTGLFLQGLWSYVHSAENTVQLLPPRSSAPPLTLENPCTELRGHFFAQVTDAAVALRAKALLSVGSNASTPHQEDGTVHPCVPLLLPTAPYQLIELNENETQIASAQALVRQFRKSQNAEAAVTLLS